MIVFKDLHQSDIATIIPMMEEFYAIDHYPIDIVVTQELFQTFIENEGLGKCWLIFHNQTLVGYLILTYVFSFEYKGQITFLDELYIKENARGKGIGRETIKFVQKYAKMHQLKVVYLEVEQHNEVAKKLYLANDFIIHNRQIMKWTPKH